MGSLVKKYTKQKLTGQVFTPSHIVNKILDDVGYNSTEILGKTILDPACGDGRFLVKIVERIIQYSNPSELANNLSKVYGFDIDIDAINKAKSQINNLIKSFNIVVEWNIVVKNSLYKITNATDNMLDEYDFIVGNPPYIRIQHLKQKERKYLQDNYRFCRSGSTDIYIAFYEFALDSLSKDGICGFITPNTFFNTDTAIDLRQYFESSMNLIQITNFGHFQLFENVTTYSAIVIFDQNSRNDFIYQNTIDAIDYKQRRISFVEISNGKIWQLSTKKIANKKGKRLGDIANIHVGITTLADRIYIMDYYKQDNLFVYLNSRNNEIIKLEKGIVKKIIKASTLKSSNESVKEYIIFPYKMINGKNTLIAELELKELFPYAYNYLLSVKSILAKRDNGKLKIKEWYAFGRSQSLNNSFGEKILFSPMNKTPNFIYHKETDSTFYSGYCIRYNGDYNELLIQLNSKEMEEYIQISSRDYRGGWKAYNKKIVQEFILDI
jgi:adenine-specific DNA-methyltransferase